MRIKLGQLLIDEDTLQKILNFLPYPFLVSQNRDGKRHNVFVNQKFLKEIGYTLEEMPTIDEWFEFAYPDKSYRAEVIRQWNEEVQTAIALGEDSASVQAKLRTKKNGDRWYEVKASFTGDMQMVAFIDIHETKSREENLKRLNENRDRILSILGHDLRGPVIHLHALSKMALSGQIDQEDYAKMMTEVNAKAFQNMEFLSNTLAWAKSNFDAIKVRIEELELKKLAEDVLLLYSGIYAGKNIHINLSIEPSFKVNADREILTAVLRNLISNAIKFSREDGTITLLAGQADYTFIEVHDNGVGMSETKIGQINSENYSSDMGTYGEKGLGIGLQLSKDLLNRMQAALQIESVPGEGTTMRIVLSGA